MRTRLAVGGASRVYRHFTEDCCSVASQVKGTILIKSHLFAITDGKQCRLVPKKIIARHSSVKMLSTIHYCIDIPATPTTVYILVTYHCARSKADYLAEYPKHDRFTTSLLKFQHASLHAAAYRKRRSVFDCATLGDHWPASPWNTTTTAFEVPQVVSTRLNDISADLREA